MDDKRDLLDAIAAAVRRGSEEQAVVLCEKAVDSGMYGREVIREGLCTGMQKAGELYEKHEYFLPELLLASETMRAAIEVVVPSLLPAERAEAGEAVVLGVVAGDVHEIGKNLVAVMLEADGYRVTDLGYDVAPERFIAELDNGGARILALSTMMTTTLPNMRMTVELARALDPRPLILVGGAPLSASVAADMGADGYEDNAARVPALIRRLLP
ncbi:MAG: cobalamin-dependent protein [Actinomycetota bacterium]|nr:cobalamin-dependent protein [Actinomycetota bacterium]MDD5665723.1 cobalamin-dependent protein [Actinomycetota bacterium]